MTVATVPFDFYIQDKEYPIWKKDKQVYQLSEVVYRKGRKVCPVIVEGRSKDIENYINSLK